MNKYNQTTEANGIVMSYNELGEGYTPIIFIHGFPFDKEMWQIQEEYFKNFHYVITYDIRGFGKSTSDETRTASIELFADDLIALMNSLHLEKAIVCGFSMGGYILLNALERFPDRFSAIVLASTQCNADTPEGVEIRNQTIIEIKKNGLYLFAKKFILKIFGVSSLKYKKKLVKTCRDNILDTSQKAITTAITALANRTDTCDSLQKIAVPVLIICGNDDTITPIEKAEFLKENIPNAILKIIKKASHMANMEQSGQYNMILNDFISNLPHLSNIKLYGNENLVIEPKLESNITAN
jgi:3-oxoadipate enol-lactonase